MSKLDENIMTITGAGWCDISLFGYHASGCSYLEDYPYAIGAMLLNGLNGKPGSVLLDFEERGQERMLLEPSLSQFKVTKANDGSVVYDRDDIGQALIAEAALRFSYKINSSIDDMIEWGMPDGDDQAYEAREILNRLSEELYALGSNVLDGFTG